MKKTLFLVLILATTSCEDVASSKKGGRILESKEVTEEKSTEFSILGNWTYYEEGNANIPKPLIQFKEGGELYIEQPNGTNDIGSYTYDSETGALSMTDPRGKVMEMKTLLEGNDTLLFTEAGPIKISLRMGMVRLER